MKIHFIGSQGVSVKKLMDLAQKFGHSVSGSDILTGGHNAKNVVGCDLVVYSSAIDKNNVELKKAKELNIPSITRAEYLGIAAKEFKNTIAVTGTHGKTTTTALIYEIFKPLKPTEHIGGQLIECKMKNAECKISDKIFNNNPTLLTSHFPLLTYFITEACEYKESFLSLYPQLAVVLNMELDHTDYYKDYKQYEIAFRQFISQSENAIVFGDDKKLNGITFGFSGDCDYTAKDIKLDLNKSNFKVHEKGKFLLTAELNIGGRFNILNALAAIAAARFYKISPKDITGGLKRFKNVGRRQEFLGELNGAKIILDYAHHSTEIKNVLYYIKEVHPKAEITAVFEPHTYTRTKALYKEFADSLSLADKIFLLPVYPAREKPIKGVSSKLILNELNRYEKGDSPLFRTYEALNKKIYQLAKDNQIIIFLGAGTIEQAARKLLLHSF